MKNQGARHVHTYIHTYICATTQALGYFEILLAHGLSLFIHFVGLDIKNVALLIQLHTYIH